MAKINLTDVITGYNASTALNENNEILEAHADNTLTRDGSSPNQMESTLDMNSNRLTNLPDAINPQEPMTLAQGVEFIDDTAAIIWHGSQWNLLYTTGSAAAY